MAKQIIIKGTSVVAANEVLVADSNSKIPAVDGSLVTTIAGGNITGTIPTARLDTGTTANKIVIATGSGLPAVDGSLLTGIVSHTTSASDPTISTNPSGGLGSEWINSTSGKQFICTDATAGANVWTCSGSGTGNIAPYYYGGESYGYSCGGYPYMATIDKYSLASDGAGVYAGFGLTAQNLYFGPQQVQSNTHGYICGGYDPSRGYLSGIEKFSFSVDATATIIGNLTQAKNGTSGCNSDTYGYRNGGGPATNVIDRFPFASDTNAVDVGDLLGNMSHGASSTEGSTYGYITGMSSGVPSSTVTKYAFSSSSNAVDTTQDLTQGRNAGGAGSSATHGYVSGGPETSSTNIIDRYQFSSSAAATDVGDLAATMAYAASSSSLTSGYNSGSSGTNKAVIEKYAFSSSANGVDIGDLPRDKPNAGGCHV